MSEPIKDFDDEPACERCGGAMVSEDCWQCGGERRSDRSSLDVSRSKRSEGGAVICYVCGKKTETAVPLRQDTNMVACERCKAVWKLGTYNPPDPTPPSPPRQTELLGGPPYIWEWLTEEACIVCGHIAPYGVMYHNHCDQFVRRHYKTGTLQDWIGRALRFKNLVDEEAKWGRIVTRPEEFP